MEHAKVAKQFWDSVHERRDAAWVADHSAQAQAEILNLPAPHDFITRLAKAEAVLDVGPGYARLLETAPAQDRWAIEISDVNACRLRDRGILLTDDNPAPLANEIDLAWSISCFPHCDYAMQAQLLRQVYAALKPGGIFFLEHVDLKEGAPDCSEETKLPAGRYHAGPAKGCGLDFLAWKSIDFTRRAIGGPQCPLWGWVARLVKPR